MYIFFFYLKPVNKLYKICVGIHTSIRYVDVELTMQIATKTRDFYANREIFRFCA